MCWLNFELFLSIYFVSYNNRTRTYIQHNVLHTYKREEQYTRKEDMYFNILAYVMEYFWGKLSDHKLEP